MTTPNNSQDQPKKKRQVPITQLDGYQAASVLIEKALNSAEKKRPILAGWKLNRRSNEYKQGYYDGLLFAHCLDALGKFPEHNRKQILKTLSL